jgi:hypothetical protein
MYTSDWFGREIRDCKKQVMRIFVEEDPGEVVFGKLWSLRDMSGLSEKLTP